MAKAYSDQELSAIKKENQRLVENKKRQYRRNNKKPFVVTGAGIMPQETFDKYFRSATDPDFKTGGF